MQPSRYILAVLCARARTPRRQSTDLSLVDGAMDRIGSLGNGRAAAAEVVLGLAGTLDTQRKALQTKEGEDKTCWTMQEIGIELFARFENPRDRQVRLVQDVVVEWLCFVRRFSMTSECEMAARYAASF